MRAGQGLRQLDGRSRRGAARQWEDWIAAQAMALAARERAPIEGWENEGGLVERTVV